MCAVCFTEIYSGSGLVRSHFSSFLTLPMFTVHVKIPERNLPLPDLYDPNGSFVRVRGGAVGLSREFDS
jgi:hypothetical protein